MMDILVSKRISTNGRRYTAEEHWRQLLVEACAEAEKHRASARKAPELAEFALEEIKPIIAGLSTSTQY